MDGDENSQDDYDPNYYSEDEGPIQKPLVNGLSNGM